MQPGVYASIQDLGRFYYKEYGVPVAGAMDLYSAKLANLMLGNDKNDAVLEVTLNGTFQFTRETTICISGADLNAILNHETLLCNHPVKVEKDSIVKFSNPEYGLRAYIAVHGGFLNKPVLGSRSLFKEITKKYRLQKDDEIFYEPFLIEENHSYASVKVNKSHFENTSIEVYKAPEYEWLDEVQKKILETEEFTISKNSNRMGYRLEERLENNLKTILTSSVLPGTVQLTPSGELIVLMRDCGVTGGYPRVLQLTEEAINRLAQKTMMNRFHFKLVDLQ